MKCAVLLLVLACQALAAPAPSATGPLSFVHEAIAESMPVRAFHAVRKIIPTFAEGTEEVISSVSSLPQRAIQTVGQFLPSFAEGTEEVVSSISSLPQRAIQTVGQFLPSFGPEEEEEEVVVETKPTHKLISLAEYPVWRVHHYNTLNLKPVPLDELTKGSFAQEVPAVVAAEYAPPVEVLPVEENPSEAFYGEDVQPDMGRLAILEPFLNMASGVRTAVGNAQKFVVGIPKRILGFVGFGGDEEEEEEIEGLPILPEVNIPELVESHLPRAPVDLPVLSAEHRKPASYVVVNKIVPEKVHKKPVHQIRVPSKPIQLTKPIVVAEVTKVKLDLSSKENEISKKPLVLKKPFVKPITIPKPILVKKPHNTASFVVPTSTIYVQEAPELPTSYHNADHVNGAINAPQQSAGGSLPTDIRNIPRLVQASVQALGNIRSIGQVADAVETYNELGDLISRSDNGGGFVPIGGFTSTKVDADTIRLAQQEPEEEGHVAKSQPQRGSLEFKPSPIDPVIYIPTTTTSTTTPASTTTTEKVVPDGQE